MTEETQVEPAGEPVDVAAGDPAGEPVADAGVGTVAAAAQDFAAVLHASAYHNRRGWCRARGACPCPGVIPPDGGPAA